LNAEDAEGEEETEGDQGKDRKAGRPLTQSTRGPEEGGRRGGGEMVKFRNGQMNSVDPAGAVGERGGRGGG
jgi:hypothetical protein